MSSSGASASLLRAASDNQQATADNQIARLTSLRHVYNAMSAHLQRPLRVLELNCGEGFIGLQLAGWGATVIGIDTSTENIDKAQAALRAHAPMPLQFLAIPMKAILDTIKPDDFDLIVDFSFHKWIYAYGLAWSRQALTKMSAKSLAGIFEVDIGQVYTGADENPARLFSGYANTSEIGDGDLPLFFASNRLTYENGQCAALREQQKPRDAFAEIYDAHNGYRYRVPTDLSVTPLPLKRVLLVGTCLVAQWVDVIGNAHDGCTCDQVLFSLSLPPDPPQPVGGYDFQVVQIPLRYVLPEQKLFRLPGSDAAECRRIFDETVEALLQYLDTGLHWNKRNGLLSFVASFLVPQQSPMGRLLPRNDLRNPVYFVEQLNARFCDALTEYKNAYLIDLNEIANNFGKKYVLNDNVYQWTHAGEMTDGEYPHERDRIEPPAKMTLHYRNETPAFIHSVWAELVANYRTIRQIDMVKLVVVDLDDTLWRGILAEKDDDPWALEGWPLGLIETLHYLKARGVLLAIISKNEEDRIEELWGRIIGNYMRLDEFAVRKINRRTKAENFEEVLRETNLLARNAVFIDDNPVERAGIKAAFPDVRVLGAWLYYIRRILLWAPETQVASLSDEAGRRTEMVQAQVAREEQRKRMTREEFLASLGLKVGLRKIADVADEKFPRAFELLNKTNQFNTTGRRWTHAECLELFSRGGFFVCFDAEDKFTKYGLIGVIIVNGGNIDQMVMSCRVAGLDIEIAAMSGVIAMTKSALRAKIIVTDANVMVRDVYKRCGFTPAGDGEWVREAGAVLAKPGHITLTPSPA